MPSGALVFADISGYTRFSRLHITSVLHAEAIISELMTAIIQAAAFPLQVGQLEGDAVVLYAAIPTGREGIAARDIARQISQLFVAFSARARALIACDAGCVCTACNEIDLLKLKAMLHFDEFVLHTVQGVTEITGPGVSALRVLAKAPVTAREYVLLTEPFYALSGAWHNRPADEQLTLPVGTATLHAQVYYPQVVVAPNVPDPRPAPNLALLVNQHSFGRMFGRKTRAPFHHLRPAPINLMLYLLEGIQSGLNVLRKSLQQFAHRPTATLPLAPPVIRPTMLMLLQITQGATATQPPLSVQLLQAVLATVQSPLVLNKLEGDAALLYATEATAVAAHQIVQQAQALYQAYRAHLQAWAETHPTQPTLHFKIVVHYGEVAFKQIQHFHEIAGPEVILLHRLLKNTVPHAAYLLLTEPFYTLLGEPATLAVTSRTEIAENIGPVSVRVATLPTTESSP